MIKPFPERLAIYARNSFVTAMVCGILFVAARGPGRSLVTGLVQDLRHDTNDRAAEVIEYLTLPQDLPEENFPDGYHGDDPLDALTHTISAATVANDTYIELLAKGWPDDIAAFAAYQKAYFLGIGNEALMALAAPYPNESNMDLWNNRQGFSIFLQVREEERQTRMSASQRDARIAELALESLLRGDLIRNADAEARVYHDPLVDAAGNAGWIIFGAFTSLVALNELRAWRAQRREDRHELLAAS
ncbi:MAG: hypothetical protein J0L97_02120 [Alphaproteobacteria bacterium]|nr:hypothetical protein [Alphaproteobacteria bacterium]